MSMVIRATKTDKGIITHGLDTGETRKYRAVRGGLSWPIMETNLPGYYCIVGEEYTNPQGSGRQQQHQRGKLHVISEYEAPNILTQLDALFTKLVDDAILCLCDTFYTVTEDFQGEDYRDYAVAFREFASQKRAGVRLCMAPWADRPDLGLYHISSWVTKGLLDFREDSVARKQLRMVETHKASQVPHTFNAVNGLRSSCAAWKTTDQGGSGQSLRS